MHRMRPLLNQDKNSLDGLGPLVLVLQTTIPTLIREVNLKRKIILSAVFLSAVLFSETSFAQNAVNRSAILSGGGLSVGTTISIRAGFGEAFGSAPGGGTNVLWSGVWLPPGFVASAVDDVPIFLGQTTLLQNNPNPFNPQTVIPFLIGQAEGRVQLDIYNIAGRLVRTLVDGPLPAGPHKIIWDGTDMQHRAVASGVYVYMLETRSFHSRRKLVLVR